MKQRIKSRWIWVAAFLALLTIILLPSVPEIVVRGDAANAEATTAAASVAASALTALATETTGAVKEEQQMAFAL